MRSRALARKGFSLIEVTLALGVAAFCLIAIFGLLPVGLKSTQTAVEQTAASNVLAAVVADLRATPRTSPPGSAAASAQFQIDIPASGTAAGASFYVTADGTFSKTIEAQSRYLVTVAFQTGLGGRTATLADVKVSWPAQTSLASAAGVVDTFVALDRN